MKIRILIILLGFLIRVSGQGFNTLPASQVSDDPYIRWIGCLPSSETPVKISFWDRTLNFIAGDNPIILNNPINIFAKSVENFRIINQGSGAILNCINGKVKIEYAFKKEQNRFPSLVGLCAYKSGDLLFTDSRLNKIFILSEDGKEIRTLNDSITLNRPTGIAYSQVTDEIFVIETGSHCISIMDSKGQRKRTIGSRGSGKLEFNFPTYIWIDGSGRIYIVDSMNFRIQVLSPEGNFISSFGEQGDATGFFARPRGLATDSQGNIYVADALFNTIQVFDLAGNFLYYFGNQGSGKNEFWMPSGIFIDNIDNLYVCDSYNGRIQMFRILKYIQK